ncbi:MAG: hypothetical protein ACTSSL_06615 [Candidatus Heimdallarchaeaceae archaeon]
MILSNKLKYIIEWKDNIYKIILKDCLIKKEDRLTEFRRYILKLIEAYRGKATFDNLLNLGLPEEILKTLLDQLELAGFIRRSETEYIIAEAGKKILENKTIPYYQKSDFSIYLIFNPLYIFKEDELFKLIIDNQAKPNQESNSIIDSKYVENLIKRRLIDINDKIKAEEGWTRIEILPITSCYLVMNESQKDSVKIWNQSYLKSKHKSGINIHNTQLPINDVSEEILLKIILENIINLINKKENLHFKEELKRINDIIKIEDGLLKWYLINKDSLLLLEELRKEKIFPEVYSISELIDSKNTNNEKELQFFISKKYEKEIFNNVATTEPRIIIRCKFVVSNKNIAEQIVEDYLIKEIEKEESVVIDPLEHLKKLAHEYWETSNFSKKFGQLTMKLDNDWIEKLAQKAYEKNCFDAYKWIKVGRDFNEK